MLSPYHPATSMSFQIIVQTTRSPQGHKLNEIMCVQPRLERRTFDTISRLAMDGLRNKRLEVVSWKFILGNALVVSFGEKLFHTEVY